MFLRFLRLLGITLSAVTGALFVIWAAGALWYDLPAPGPWRKAAAVLLLPAVAAMWLSAKRWLRISACMLPVLIAGWWFSLKPSNDRQWLPDVSRTGSAEIRGDPR